MHFSACTRYVSWLWCIVFSARLVSMSLMFIALSIVYNIAPFYCMSWILALYTRVRNAFYRTLGCMSTVLSLLTQCVCCCFWWRNTRGGGGASAYMSEALNAEHSSKSLASISSSTRNERKARKISDESDISTDSPNLEEERKFDHRKSSMLVTDDDEDDDADRRQRRHEDDDDAEIRELGEKMETDCPTRPSRFAWLSSLFSRRGSARRASTRSSSSLSSGNRSSGTGIGEELLPHSMTRSDAENAKKSKNSGGRRRRSAPTAAASSSSSAAYPAQAYAINSHAATSTLDTF